MDQVTVDRTAEVDLALAQAQGRKPCVYAPLSQKEEAVVRRLTEPLGRNRGAQSAANHGGAAPLVLPRGEERSVDS